MVLISLLDTNGDGGVMLGKDVVISAHASPMAVHEQGRWGEFETRRRRQRRHRCADGLYTCRFIYIYIYIYIR